MRKSGILYSAKQIEKEWDLISEWTSIQETRAFDFANFGAFDFIDFMQPFADVVKFIFLIQIAATQIVDYIVFFIFFYLNFNILFVSTFSSHKEQRSQTRTTYFKNLSMNS